MALPPLNTCGARYTETKLGQDSWFFGEWSSFLREAGLVDLSSFLQLSGEVIDRNRRSVVSRIEIGVEKRVFYLKVHKNYFKQNFRTYYRKVPIVYKELQNMMYYGCAGLDDLEPVAWGYRLTASGMDSFLLLEELAGYTSLEGWLKSPRDYHELAQMTEDCAGMVRTFHQHGLVHRALFSRHIFIKKLKGKYNIVPLDLERTRKCGKWPLARFFFKMRWLYDLATLHLTILWPAVSSPLRMRFFLKWCRAGKLNFWNKIQVKLILFLSLKLSQKRGLFRMYGVDKRLAQRK